MKRIDKVIVYVNFSPYDNSGNILDYFIQHYRILIHFSFDHLRLKNGRNTNILTVYQNGVIKRKIKMISSRVPQPLLFPSLPIIGIIMILQTWWYVYRFSYIYGISDYYFSVNGFPAWVGTTLKYFKLVKKTIFWVWDYFPPHHPSKRIRLIRSFYWYFDALATKHSDVLLFPNKRLRALRINLGIIKPFTSSSFMPIGTAISVNFKPRNNNKTKLIIGHLGMLKWEQGLFTILEQYPSLLAYNPHLRLEIIGSGPDEEALKKLAKTYGKNIIFHGFIPDLSKLNTIVRSWTLGLATYVPHKSNPSYWTDPSKIKLYMSQAVPVITTNVTDLAKEIRKYDAGIVINYNSSTQLIQAIDKISNNRSYYAKNAFQLAKKYNYQEIYKKLLSY